SITVINRALVGLQRVDVAVDSDFGAAARFSMGAIAPGYARDATYQHPGGDEFLGVGAVGVTGAIAGCQESRSSTDHYVVVEGGVTTPLTCRFSYNYESCAQLGGFCSSDAECCQSAYEGPRYCASTPEGYNVCQVRPF